MAREFPHFMLEIVNSTVENGIPMGCHNACAGQIYTHLDKRAYGPTMPCQMEIGEASTMSWNAWYSCRDPLLDVSAFNAQGGNVIIGTPGRLSDVMKRCESLDCKNLEVASLSSPALLPSYPFQTSFEQPCFVDSTLA